MIAWRIAKAIYALDRTGIGGLLEGGRWHRVGDPVLYAGLSPEIAALEKLVHTGRFLPKDLVLVEIQLPDTPALYEEPHPLPVGWGAIPPDDTTARYGSEFLRSRRALALIVRSAIIPEARNIVINPMHTEFSAVLMRVVRSFTFDPRLR